MSTPGIVIVGAGECGARAALGLRLNGYIGDIKLIGSEDHLPYERPPLSKAASDRGNAGPVLVANREQYEKERVSILTGTRVVEIDSQRRSVKLHDGRSIPYEKLLLTLGAEPRRMPGTDPSSTRILTLRTFDDAAAIRGWMVPDRHIIVVGGGFIGLEVAAMARLLGSSVTVLETQHRILMRGVSQEIAELLAERHRSEGVNLRCGVRIEKIEEDEEAITFILSDGSIVTGDAAVIGIGVRPNTELAEKAGIWVDNGIAVNERLETSVPGIFAAGDCVSFPHSVYDGRRIRLEAWRNAQDQAELAARILTGTCDVVGSIPWFWSDQYDLHLQVAGVADGASSHVSRCYPDGGLVQFHLAEDGRLLAASGLSVGYTIAKDIRLCEMMIAARATPDPIKLASAERKLKSLIS